MTTVESNAASLSPEISTRLVDAAIAATLGLNFRFLTEVEKALPRSYSPKPSTPSTPSTRLARTLEEIGCVTPDAPNCEGCDDWWTCATPQEASE